MPALTDFRSAVAALIGTAADPSTWTTDLLDEGLRGGLMEIDPWVVYEDAFTVAVASQSQTIAIADLLALLAVAWPWDDAARWRQKYARWRWIAPSTVYFERDIPQPGDEIRVRFTKRHRIENLDSAAATTVPPVLERPLVYAAAARTLDIRLRQLTENPAVPATAFANLKAIAAGWRAIASELFATGLDRPVWSDYGL